MSVKRPSLTACWTVALAIAGDAVKSVLVQRSIGNIEPRGLGSLMPVASNDTEEGREKNRRVEAWVFAQR